MLYLFDVIKLFLLLLRMMVNGCLLYLMLWRILLLILPATKLYYAQRYEKRFSYKLVSTLSSLGPAFIKIGQLLATREDIIGKRIAHDLQNLYNNAKAVRWDGKKGMRNILLSHFNGDINTIFHSVDQIPIATASVAQVHRAQTCDGNQIILKILKPNIRAKFLRNIKLLCAIVRISNLFLRRSKKLKLIDVLKFVEETSKFELNMLYEASAMSHMRRIMDHDSGIYIPKVFWEYSSGDILATEWIDGYTIQQIYNDISVYRESFNIKDIITNIVEAFLEQLFVHGFFHADIHPGNIIIRKHDKAVVFIDFGMSQFISKRNKHILGQIIYFFVKKDYQRVAELHFEGGYISDKESVNTFALMCHSIIEPLFSQSSLSKIRISSLLKRLLLIAEQFNITMQTELLMTQKNFITIENIIRKLDSSINLWGIMEEWFIKAKKNHPEMNKERFAYKVESIIAKKAKDIVQMIRDC